MVLSKSCIGIEENDCVFNQQRLLKFETPKISGPGIIKGSAGELSIGETTGKFIRSGLASISSIKRSASKFGVKKLAKKMPISGKPNRGIPGDRYKLTSKRPARNNSNSI